MTRAMWTALAKAPHCKHAEAHQSPLPGPIAAELWQRSMHCNERSYFATGEIRTANEMHLPCQKMGQMEGDRTGTASGSRKPANQPVIATLNVGTHKCATAQIEDAGKRTTPTAHLIGALETPIAPKYVK